MVWHKKLHIFGVPLSPRMRDALRTSGVVSLLQVLFHYTFMGELFARAFRDATGENPIEEIKIDSSKAISTAPIPVTPVSEHPVAALDASK